MELINGCNGEIELWSSYTDCFPITHGIGNTSFQHCPREANKVARNLAGLAFVSDTEYYFLLGG
jgi:hypothetical protein